MSDALTHEDAQVIDRLIQAGIFANRAEVIRAGLKDLESRYFYWSYLNPLPLEKGVLTAIYEKQSGEEWPEEQNLKANL